MALNRSPEFCLKLTYRYLLKAVTPEAGQFRPQGHNLKKNLVEVHQVMLHTKYQGSRFNGSRQEDF